MSRREADLFAGAAYDPSAAAGRVAWQRSDGQARLMRGGGQHGLPGTHPALGGGLAAWLEPGAIVIADAATLRPLQRFAAPGAGALAVSDALLAWRTRDAAGTDRIWALARGGQPVALVASPAPNELGRPALAGGHVLCHVAGPGGSRLLSVDAASGAQQLLRKHAGAQVTNPATDGTRLLYVHATGRSQQLRIGALAPARARDDEIVLVHPSSGQRDREHEPGRKRHRHQGKRPKLPPIAKPGVVDTLWTTALTGDAAYVTRIRARAGAPRRTDILRVPIAA